MKSGEMVTSSLSSYVNMSDLVCVMSANLLKERGCVPRDAHGKIEAMFGVE